MAFNSSLTHPIYEEVKKKITHENSYVVTPVRNPQLKAFAVTSFATHDVSKHIKLCIKVKEYVAK